MAWLLSPDMVSPVALVQGALVAVVSQTGPGTGFASVRGFFGGFRSVEVAVLLLTTSSLRVQPRCRPFLLFDGC